MYNSFNSKVGREMPLMTAASLLSGSSSGEKTKLFKVWHGQRPKELAKYPSHANPVFFDESPISTNVGYGCWMGLGTRVSQFALRQIWHSQRLVHNFMTSCAMDTWIEISGKSICVNSTQHIHRFIGRESRVRPVLWRCQCVTSVQRLERYWHLSQHIWNS